MKQITIAGGIGKDAVLRTTQQGEKVAGFSVGVTEGFGQNKRTLWFDVSIWGNRADKLAPHLTKGSRVTVAGDLSTREHDGKTYLTLRASEITLQGGGQRDNGPSGYGGGSDDQGYGQQSSGYGAGGRPSGRGGDLDDEIPFQMEWR